MVNTLRQCAVMLFIQIMVCVSEYVQQCNQISESRFMIVHNCSCCYLSSGLLFGFTFGGRGRTVWGVEEILET